MAKPKSMCLSEISQGDYSIGKNDSPAKAWRVGTRYGLPRLRTIPWALHGPSRDVARGEIGGGLTTLAIAALL